MSRFLGFDEYAAPKLMALAAYGDPGRYAAGFRELVCVGDDGDFSINNEVARFRTDDFHPIESLFYRRGPGRPVDHRDADLAASLQLVTEQVFDGLAAAAQRATTSRNLCLAGGVALNCVAVGRLAASGRFDRYFVQPLANDAGTALGAALWATRERGGPVSSWAMNPYLGPGYSDAEIAAALAGSGLRYRQPSELDAAVVALLTAGQIGGWFQGRMELGPRALGNRSIIADPRRAGARELINLKAKHREYFRPFAPAVMEDQASEWFALTGSSRSWAFMSLACPVLPDKRSLIPAVVHVDGSARVQVVSRELNPRFHRLLDAFRSETGVPLLLNTSFNGPEEPIVASPVEAIQLFQTSGLDFLAIGSYLVGRDGPRT
jgi:carbamoyltransferase